MFDASKNINNGRKISILGNDIKTIGNKCENIIDIMPSKYRSVEVSTILKEIYSIKHELSSIGNELENLGEIIVSVSKELDNNSSRKNGGSSW
ncbi:MAG: hypothetical protein E7G24_03760 [Clostridium celatum]|nr:hypothetical protein [Clostridium celatum]